MSSELERIEQEKRRRLEEEARRREEEERLRAEVRQKYKEAEDSASRASREGQEIARKAAEQGAKLGEEQAKQAYEEAQRKVEALRTPTYLQLPGAGKSSPSGSGLPLTSIATPLPRVYYVIIGCGTAAVVNHTTLRQTKWGMAKRIDKLPVMHIGFKDPWFHYIPHGMGQPPYLLTMPGYHQRVSQATDVSDRNPGCRSDRFAACTQNEWNQLWAKYHQDDARQDEFAWKQAFVVWIESADRHPDKATIKTKLKNEGLDFDVEKAKDVNKDVAALDENYVQKIPEARYRILIVVPQDETTVRLEYVYAAKIDICSGAGRPRVPEGKAWDEGRTRLWTPPIMWGDKTKKRRLVTGPEGFYTETIWNGTDRVYINGGGGIGLNMAERAEIVGCFADWAPGATLHNTFNLPRNDIVLKHPNKNINDMTLAGIEEFCTAVLRDPTAGQQAALWIVAARAVPFTDKENLKTRISTKLAEVRGTGPASAVSLFSRLSQLPDGVLFDLLDINKEPMFHRATMAPGESGVRRGPFMAPTNNTVVLTPSYPKWRFGGGSEVRIVSNKPTDPYVVVKIEGSKDRANPLAPAKTPFLRDYHYQNTNTSAAGAFLLSTSYQKAFPELGTLNESAGGNYNRICLTTGIVPNERGTAEDFAAAFLFERLAGPGDGRTVGLEADGGRIRILGASAQVHSSNKFKIAAPAQVQADADDEASKFFFTLPMSAVVPGFIFSGVNIAEANHYFNEGQPNVNVNTMTTTDLIKSASDIIRKSDYMFADSDVTKIAAAVSKYRRLRNGYESRADIETAFATDPAITSIGLWRGIVEQLFTTLTTDYPPARTLLTTDRD